VHRYNSVEYQLSTVFNRRNVMEHIFLPTGKDGVAYCLYEHYVFISADKHVYAYTMLPRYILIHMCIESVTILLWWRLKRLKKCLKKIASPWHGFWTLTWYFTRIFSGLCEIFRSLETVFIRLWTKRYPNILANFTLSRSRLTLLV